MTCWTTFAENSGLSLRLSDFLMLALLLIGWFVFEKNNYKKIYFIALFLCLSLNICERGWYSDKPVVFQRLFWGIVGCLFVLFFLIEKTTEILSRKTNFTKRIWLKVEKNEPGLDNTLNDILKWLSLDVENFRNLESVKSRIFIRSLHTTFLLLTVVLISIFVFDIEKFDATQIVLSVPAFFAVYFSFGNQYWNQWNYAAELFNSLDGDDADYDNRKYCLGMDLIVLDLWANRAFSPFFTRLMEELDPQKSIFDSDGKMFVKDAWNKLADAQEASLEFRPDFCGHGSHI